MDLEDLLEERREVEEQLQEYFGDDDDFFSGDHGYQILLERLNSISEQIEAFDCDE